MADVPVLVGSVNATDNVVPSVAGVIVVMVGALGEPWTGDTFATYVGDVPVNVTP
jgi:hypothetical protein